jgi:hypothetical protein
MQNATNTPELDSTELARKAINHVLNKIKTNPDIRYHMGACTQSFELLKAAHSALNGISEEAIEAEVLVQLTRRSAAEKLSAIQDIADSCTNRDMIRIQEICRE